MIGAGLLGSGCWSSHTEIVREKPIIVRESAPSTTIVAPGVMPPPVVETPGLAPRAGAIWLSGHWEHEPRGWLWVPGHWD